MTAPALLAAGFVTADDGVFCTCATLGPGHFCPMHDTQPHHSNDETDTQNELPDCALSSGVPVSTVTLSSLLGAVGLVPIGQALQASLVLADPITTTPHVEISRPHVPDSPPPRSTLAEQPFRNS
jgi:hypothetical protein